LDQIGRSEGRAEDEKLLVKLEAAVALLFGLKEADVREIYETFQAGWGYEPELAEVLAQMKEAKND
jgi:hypothetical protein